VPRSIGENQDFDQIDAARAAQLQATESLSLAAERASLEVFTRRMPSVRGSASGLHLDRDEHFAIERD